MMSDTERQPPSGPIDRTALARIDELGGPPLVAQMIALFAEHGGSLATAIAEAARAGDRAGVRRAAHSLRSTAGNLGATRLVQLATDLEQGAETLTAERVRRAATEIVSEVEHARRHLTVLGEEY